MIPLPIPPPQKRDPGTAEAEPGPRFVGEALSPRSLGAPRYSNIGYDHDGSGLTGGGEVTWL